MNRDDSKRKLKALEILATVNAHKKMKVYERLSEQQGIVQRLEAERESIEKKIDITNNSLGVKVIHESSFCPELYGAKLAYIQYLYENKGACDLSIVSGHQALDQAKNLLSEITSRVNLIDDKYAAEKLKYIAQIIKLQGAQ